MDAVGPIGLLLIAQITVVTVIFARAFARAVAQHHGRAPTRTPEGRRDHRRRTAAGTARASTVATAGATAPPTIAQVEEELAALLQERGRAADALARLRAEHAAATTSFAERRRATLQELHELRRHHRVLVSDELALTARIGELSTDLRHLEQRRAMIAGELTASTATSHAIATRTDLARAQLRALKRETDGLVAKARRERAHLSDLTRRRALLSAENDELAALLDVLQQLTGHSSSLTRLSDERQQHDDEQMPTGEQSRHVPARLPTQPHEARRAHEAAPAGGDLLAAEPRPTRPQVAHEPRRT